MNFALLFSLLSYNSRNSDPGVTKQALFSLLTTAVLALGFYREKTGPF